MQVVGSRWQAVGDGWQVAGGSEIKKYDDLIKLLLARQHFSFPERCSKLPNISVDAQSVPVKGIFSWFPVPKIQF